MVGCDSRCYAQILTVFSLIAIIVFIVLIALNLPGTVAYSIFLCMSVLTLVGGVCIWIWSCKSQDPSPEAGRNQDQFTNHNGHRRVNDGSRRRNGESRVGLRPETARIPTLDRENVSPPWQPDPEAAGRHPVQVINISGSRLGGPLGNRRTNDGSGRRNGMSSERMNPQMPRSRSLSPPNLHRSTSPTWELNRQEAQCRTHQVALTNQNGASRIGSDRSRGRNPVRMGRMALAIPTSRSQSLSSSPLGRMSAETLLMFCRSEENEQRELRGRFPDPPSYEEAMATANTTEGNNRNIIPGEQPPPYDSIN